MRESYIKLIQLQKETVGATFFIGFSTKTNKHYVVFNLKQKRFEHSDVVEVLEMAASWVIENREKNLKNDYPYYTLHKFY